MCNSTLTDPCYLSCQLYHWDLAQHSHSTSVFCEVPAERTNANPVGGAHEHRVKLWAREEVNANVRSLRQVCRKRSSRRARKPYEGVRGSTAQRQTGPQASPLAQAQRATGRQARIGKGGNAFCRSRLRVGTITPLSKDLKRPRGRALQNTAHAAGITLSTSYVSITRSDSSLSSAPQALQSRATSSP